MTQYFMWYALLAPQDILVFVFFITPDILFIIHIANLAQLMLSAEEEKTLVQSLSYK